MREEVAVCCENIHTMVDVKFMTGDLHELKTPEMQSALQAEIDSLDTTQYDAILLGYGLCSNGIETLSAPIPLVVPRVHDCIALFMGSHQRYQTYFDNNSGTFYQSPGWLEKDIDGDNALKTTAQALGLLKNKEEYIQKYGEKRGTYLYEALGGWESHYQQVAYIDTVTKNADYYKESTKKMAERHQWKYDEIPGDTRLIVKLLNGEWNPEEFLVVPANQKIIPSYDEGIITYQDV